MKGRPILFNGDMVRAILDDRKTQTRRPVKYIPVLGEPIKWCAAAKAQEPEWVRIVGDYRRFCPFGQPGGSTVWVRESFWQSSAYPFTMPSGEASPQSMNWGGRIRYAADGDPENTPNRHYPKGLRHGLSAPDPDAVWLKRPSIHMPREVSRITLEITAVRVERVQDITEDDAIADAGLKAMTEDHIWCIAGTDGQTTRDPRFAFGSSWDARYAKLGLSWEANPWVWVVEFRRIA